MMIPYGRQDITEADIQAGVQSFKMDYRTLFSWHPDYECINHKIRHHDEASYTDVQEEWVAVSVLRKCRREPNA